MQNVSVSPSSHMHMKTVALWHCYMLFLVDYIYSINPKRVFGTVCYMYKAPVIYHLLYRAIDFLYTNCESRNSAQRPARHSSGSAHFNTGYWLVSAVRAATYADYPQNPHSHTQQELASGPAYNTTLGGWGENEIWQFLVANY